MRSKTENPDINSEHEDPQIGLRIFNKFPPLLYLGTAVAIALVLSVGMVALYFSDKQKEEEKWVEHTYVVLNNTVLVQKDLSDLLSTGEIATHIGHTSDLQTKKLIRRIDTLATLVRDNTAQKAIVQMIQKHVNVLLNSLSASPALSSHSKNTEAELQKETKLIRSAMDNFNSNEQLLLTKQINENKKLRERTSISIIIAILLILAIVSFLVYLVLTEFRKGIRAYEKEKEISTLKSNFVSLASHEFRTPLSSVLLSVNLIERYATKQDSENIIKHCQKIKHSVNNLNGILEDFLSLEKLNTGKVKPIGASFNLQELCMDITEDMQTIVKPGQVLAYEFEGQAEASGLDEHLIRNSVINLISNAIKYAGNEAHILLKTSVNTNRVTISVQDDGIGISSKDQRNLFKPFFRVDQNGNIPGTGLGLNIVLRYVELMNGTLILTSKPNEGACFTMSFANG